MSFTDKQIKTLVILERLGGSLSLVSVTLVFVAYAAFPRLRTVPNTFIVFASIANAGASAGSVIAYDGLFKGESSSLCQAQGFMFEFFIQSDPWWALAMAINVLLIFFTKTKPSSIKKWGWVYCLVCYGGPFVIALVCLQLRDPTKSNVYGDAGLWCWITSDWGPLRIYSYYMLIWICMLVSMIIYIGIGIYVFRVRNRLHQISGPDGDAKNIRGLASYSPPPTETSKADEDHIYQGPVQFSTVSSQKTNWPSASCREHAEGTVNVITEVNVHVEHSRLSYSSPDVSPPARVYRPTDSPYLHRAAPNPHRAMGTHIASHSKDLAIAKPRWKNNCLVAKATGLLDSFVVADPVKRAYLRTSLLFGISVLVTWIPSSVNRIHGLLSNNSPYEYNLATATVLPLQGVWNGLIFFVTTWRVFRECMRDWRSRGEGVVELTPRADTMSTRDRHRYGDSGADPVPRLTESTRRARSESWDFNDPGHQTEGVLGLGIV